MAHFLHRANIFAASRVFDFVLALCWSSRIIELSSDLFIYTAKTCVDPVIQVRVRASLLLSFPKQSSAVGVLTVLDQGALDLSVAPLTLPASQNPCNLQQLVI